MQLAHSSINLDTFAIKHCFTLAAFLRNSSPFAASVATGIADFLEHNQAYFVDRFATAAVSLGTVNLRIVARAESLVGSTVSTAPEECAH